MMNIRVLWPAAAVTVGLAMIGWLPVVAAQDGACRAADLQTSLEQKPADELLSRSMLALWRGLDTSADGYIDEREAAVEPQLFACFSVLDADADSRLNATEFTRFRFIRSDSLAGDVRDSR